MARTKTGPPRHADLSWWDFHLRYPLTMRIGSGKRSLLDLPDELLLLIASNLQALRLDQTQSQAFRNKQKETSRQFENLYRRSALYALCLTSKRLNRIALPALYNAITGSTTCYGITPLRLVWKTLTEKEALRLHVEYVENLLSDCLGNDLRRDMEIDGAEDIVSEYFEKLAEIISMCPNIRQISVVSIENSHNFTLWGKLLLPIPRPRGEPYEDGRARNLASSDSLLRLEKIAFQTNTKDEYVNRIPSFPDILSALSQCHSVVELRASGVAGSPSLVVAPERTFQNLQRLEITACTLALRDVNNALSACDNLRHFVCHWSYFRCFTSDSQVNLLPNLTRHQTLESLWLVADMVDLHSENQVHVSCPSICQMTTLKEAKLCNLFLPGKYRRGHVPMGANTVPIAPELPASVEHLTISYTLEWVNPTAWYTSVCQSLYRLAADCPRYLPRLRELVVVHTGFGQLGRDGEDDERLVQAFEEKGVQLNILRKFDILAALP